MRILAPLLCFFLLLMVMGTFSYVYLLWRSYVIKMASLKRGQFPSWPGQEVKMSNNNNKKKKSRWEQQDLFINEEVVRAKKLLKTNNKQVSTTTLSVPIIPKDKLLSRLNHYESQILSQFRNSVVDISKSIELGEVKNSYHVDYAMKSLNEDDVVRNPADSMDLLCDLLNNVSVETFIRGDEFFKMQQLDDYFPKKPLFDPGKKFDSCGVVSSSGSMLGSKLGDHVDANDFVIRFNNAPTTQEYSKDVGSKTSLRIVNSQVVGKPEFKFLDSRNGLYEKSPVLVWDPSGYNATLSAWYKNPDYPFFETFFSKRLMKPDEELHLLHPRSLWSIWNYLQKHTADYLLPNPPSSGFLGVVLALFNCRKVHVYEYVPSMRLTKRCHYYNEEENLGCTIGDWHPLAAEKLTAFSLSTKDKVEIFQYGYLTIRSNCNKNSH